jgi:hypothetical protein
MKAYLIQLPSDFSWVVLVCQDTVYIYVCLGITPLCYPTLFIVHLLDQPLGYLVLSIDSLGLSRDDLSSVYI